MQIDRSSGLLDGVRYLRSPNCSARPPGAVVEALIVHCISLPPGHFGGDDIELLFQNRLDPGKHPAYREIAGEKVSAHFLVRRDGTLTQFVPITACAWHAGVSHCLGRAHVNEFSVGIELEGAAESAFEEAQYQTLATLTGALLRACPQLRREHIFGHEEIAPLRKKDPGPHFDWPHYRALLEAAG